MLNLLNIFCLLKLGKSEDIIRHICLVFTSFLPLFYLCYISLIVKVVVSKNLYSCFDRLSDIVLYLT